MSELQEKREYYPDRSLKAVYFVDEQGKKQGNYTVYKQNSNKILDKLEYKDGAVWNGQVKTKDGYIIYEDGEKSEEFKETSRRRYDYSSGKLKRKKGSKWDFPFVDYVETETIKNGESVRTKEFTYEALTNDNYICTEKLRHQTSYENGVRVDKIEMSTSWRKTYKGYEGPSFDNRVEWTCTLKNGELTEYSDRLGYHASFEKGVLTGDYRMPLNKNELVFNRSPWAIKTGEDLIDKISIPMIDIKGTFYLDFDDTGLPDNIPPIVVGTWNDGKFTGEVNYYDRDFSAKWDDGKMTGDLLRRGRRGDVSIHYHWQDGVCHVVERTKDGDFTLIYTLRNGKKDGLYQEIKRGSTCVEESEYKDGKLHGMSRKYNKEELWLESETQYKDGKKHGFEKLYNSDGSIAEIKYWQEDKDCTAKYKKLKKIATGRINEEKQIEAETGEKKSLPKMNKLEKKIAMAKEILGLSK